MAADNCAVKHKVSPKTGFVAVEPTCDPNTNIITPLIPIATPEPFISVIGNFRKTAARSIVNIGVKALITEASTGLVKPTPIMYNP